MELSATVLTHNSASTIKLTLESLSGLVTDLVVVDDFSDDETTKIVSKIWPSARIFTRALNNDFAGQRNFALGQCRAEWAIIIDSDEEISNDLKSSIEAALVHPGGNEAFNCIRRNFNFAGSTPVLLDRPILQRRALLYRFSIHERIDSIMTPLMGELLHHSWDGTEDFINEINRYSTWKAVRWQNEARRYSDRLVVVRQILFAAYIFARRYFIERRFLAGTKGLIYCLAWSAEELFVAMKFIENKNPNGKSQQKH